MSSQRPTAAGILPGRIGVYVVAVLLLLLLTITTTPLAAQDDDIKTFSLTDFGGEFSVRYLLDDWSNSNPSASTFVNNPTWYEELYLSARGYVYHPAFLDWTVGGGPLLVQWAYESEAGENSGSEALFNFDAELNFLDLRAYPFTLYLHRDHPEIISGVSGRFLVETNEYGIRGLLRGPASPVSMIWDVGHKDSTGSGFGTTVDEDMNRASLRAALAYLERHNLRLALNWNERDSNSGAPGLPIQQSQIETTTAELNGDNTFGDTGQMLLRQNLRWLRQETTIATTTELETLAYNGNFKWEHNKSTRSFANLNYVDTDRTESWSRTGDLQAGVTHNFSEDVAVTGRGEYSRDKTPGFDQDMAGARISGNYQRSLAFGSLGMSALAGMRRTDQQSDTDRVTVFDESVVLVGTVPVALSRDFVVVESVVVTNVPKTQTFEQDIDYRLVTIGSTTTIERLITGVIEDGQTVLVTYDALTGGTVKYDTLSQGFNLSLGLWRYANLYFIYRDTDNDVIEGVATTPLNDVNRIEFGGRVNYPFNSGWSVGGVYRYTRQDEDISPYTRNIYEAFTQSGRYWNTRVRFLVHHETVDYERSREDVDLYRYMLGINSRLPGGVVLAYHGEYSEDTGGSLPREEKRHSLSLNWIYRQVFFSLQASSGYVTQGDNIKNNKRVTAMLRRVF